MNPGRSNFIFAIVRRFNCERREDDKMERTTARRPQEDEKGGSGEERKKRPAGANAEWLQEKGIWFVSKTIKWLTPIKGLTWCEKNNNVLPSCVICVQFSLYNEFVIMKKLIQKKNYGVW